MLLRITHETRIAYSRPASFATHVLRKTPRTFDGQFVRVWRVDVDHDSRLDRIIDPFGNIVQTFSTDGPMEKLLIAATGEVEVDDTNGVVQRRPERFPLGIYLRDTPFTRPHAALAAFADETVAGVETTLSRGHAMMNALHDRLAGQVADGGSDEAGEAFDGPHCTVEGLAHVFAAALRHLGTPARVVNGYLWREEEPAGGRHVWAEAHVENLGWVGFDVLHDRSPTDAYVRVATALDHLGAAPMRSSFTGLGERTIETDVLVERVGR
jgi:transglutaminase-like putative cysteine protease